MRNVGKLTLALTVAFLFVALVGGQQPGGGGFGGGGFGGKSGGAADPLALLRNESVKKELGLTDEQVGKIPGAVQKALADILDAKQLKRLREIEMQQRGTAALADTRVQKELKISDEQSQTLKTILEDTRKQQAELLKGAKGDFKGMREKTQALQKETTEKLNEVLTSEQRRAFKQLQGEEFKMSFPGGGDFKKKKKKTDDL